MIFVPSGELVSANLNAPSCELENRSSKIAASFEFRLSFARHSSLALTPSGQSLTHHLCGFTDLVGISRIEADKRHIHGLDVLKGPFDGLALLSFRLAFAACRQHLKNQRGFIHLAHGLGHLR